MTNTDNPPRQYPPAPWWVDLSDPKWWLNRQIESIAALTVSTSGVPNVVITELNKTTFDQMEKALIASLSAGEVGPNGDFNTLYGGTEWTGSLDGFPNWAGVVVTDSSGNQSTTHAYGALQFEPDTWNLIAGLNGGRFSVVPQNQLWNGLYLAYKDFKSRSGSNLHDTLVAGRLTQIPLFLGLTWPGGASSSFPARYTTALGLFQDTPIPVPPPPSPLPPTPPGDLGIINITISAQVTVAQLSAILAITGKGSG